MNQKVDDQLRILQEWQGHADWCVYVLECVDGSYYTGVTNNLPRRLSQHASGKASKYTRSRRPASLVWWKPVDCREDALRLEWRIKSLRRSKKEDIVKGIQAQWIQRCFNLGE